MISKTAIIYPNVTIGESCIIEDFVIIGIPPHDHREGELKTIIGNNALIRSHTVIYAGNIIGNGFRTGNKANIRELNEIGDDVSIGTLSVIEHHVKIGHHVRVHTQVFIPEYTIIEDESWLGPKVVLTNSKYPKSTESKRNLFGAHIKRNAIIGANATVLPGIVIGFDSFVGAGSIVTKDVPDRCVVAGSPAVFLKQISDIKAYYDKSYKE